MDQHIRDDVGDVNSFPAPALGKSRLINTLRYRMTTPDFENLFQEILNIGYTEWQKPENDWGFARMLNWMSKNYGEESAFLIMLGKFNQQVENGGITQWIDNGYASNDKKHSYGRDQRIDISLLEKMIEYFESSPLKETEIGEKVYHLLIEIRDLIEETADYCQRCRNHRYIRCTSCNGTGRTEDDEECEECEGEGEAPCDLCNPEGQVDLDAKVGELNSFYIDRLDQEYYKYSEKWMQEIENYLKQEIRAISGGGLLSRAQAFKTIESYLNSLEALLEAIESL